MIKFLFLIFSFAFGLLSYGQEVEKNSWIKFNGAFVLQSSQQKAGALLSSAPFIFPGIGVTLFDQLSIRGPALVWTPFDRKNSVSLKSEIKYFNDETSFLVYGRSADALRRGREAALFLNLELQYKFGFMKLFYLGAFLEYDFLAFKNVYAELKAGLPLLPFTQLNFALSLAPQKTYQYYYGSGAEAGLGHLQARLSFFYPKVPWNGALSHSVEYSRILNGSNVSASFVRGKKNNLIVSTLFLFNF